jgi:hypothetical protein
LAKENERVVVRNLVYRVSDFPVGRESRGPGIRHCGGRAGTVRGPGQFRFPAYEFSELIDAKEWILVKVMFEREASSVVAGSQAGRIGNHDATPARLPAFHFKRHPGFSRFAHRKKSSAWRKNLALCGPCR